MIAAPASRPAGGYAEAIERVKTFQALDDASILPEARTALFECGQRTPLAVVLFHGFTNNPAQYSAFAPLLHERGVNVFVPRMPEHGDRDRMSARIKDLTAEALLASASEAVDIACGLGERVALLGISMGGTLCAYFAQYRDVELPVPVAPNFALLQLPYGASRVICSVLSWFPNAFLWWDPRLKAKLEPHTAYPRFSTRALAQTLRVADDVHRACSREAPKAHRIVFMINRCDPAVNNEVSEEIAKQWSGWKKGVVEFNVMRDLPEWHDIIDPRNEQARTDLVYPRLLQALGV